MGLECRFCQGNDLVNILNLGNMPLAGAFLRREDFNNEKIFPLSLSFCRDCTLVQVNEKIPADILYGHYLFSSSVSKEVVRHFDKLANEINMRFLGDKLNPLVLEIGSNDGVLLKFLDKLDIWAIGVDPVMNEYFSEDYAIKFKRDHGPVDVISSSYTLTHIEDIINVMQGIKLLLKEDGVLIFETYYLANLIEENQYDMVYHEHMSYVSLLSLEKLLDKFDLEVFDVNYDPKFRSGCIKFYIGHKGQRQIHPCVEETRSFEKVSRYDKLELWHNFSKKIWDTRIDLMDLLNRIKLDGAHIIGYGATGRGTVMMNYCGIYSNTIDYVVDDTPAKQGLYTPGTHVPIRAWDPDFSGYAILFAWAFADEIIAKRGSDKVKFIIPLPEVRVI
jgi:methylation protein EvaC